MENETNVVAEQPLITTTQITSETTRRDVTSYPELGPNPVTLLCRTCNQTVTTNVVKEPHDNKSELASLLCRHCCCICIPCIFCPRAFMVLNHYCPNCNTFQGRSKPTMRTITSNTSGR